MAPGVVGKLWPQFLEFIMHHFQRRVRGVFVRAYRRVRFGRTEQVCQHWRAHPGQLSLF